MTWESGFFYFITILIAHYLIVILWSDVKDNKPENPPFAFLSAKGSWVKENSRIRLLAGNESWVNRQWIGRTSFLMADWNFPASQSPWNVAPGEWETQWNDSVSVWPVFSEERGSVETASLVWNQSYDWLWTRLSQLTMLWAQSGCLPCSVLKSL